MAASVVIINSIATATPGWGSPTSWKQSLGVALSGASPGAKTLVLASQYPVTSGKVRVQIIGGGTSDVTASFTLSGTDGTGTVDIANVPATKVVNVDSSGLDMVFFFRSDIAITTFTLTPALLGTTKTCTLNWEVAGNA